VALLVDVAEVPEAADDDGSAIVLHLVGLPAGIAQRVLSRVDGDLRAGPHLTQVLLRDVGELELLEPAAQATPEAEGLALRNELDPGTARAQGVCDVQEVVAEAAHDAEPCHYHAAHGSPRCAAGDGMVPIITCTARRRP